MLTDIYGPMFAEKTHTLQSAGRKELIAKKHVLAFKHKDDNKRYGENLKTHDRRSFPAKSVEQATEIYQALEKYVRRNKIRDLSRITLLIDEAQFFSPNLVDLCSELKPSMNIYIAHLDRDYLGKPMAFEKSERHVGELMALADHRIHLKAVCTYPKRGSVDNCGRDATYTQKIDIQGNPLLSGKTEKEKAEKEVGGKGVYAPRCWDHYAFPKGDYGFFSTKDLLEEALRKRIVKKKK